MKIYPLLIALVLAGAMIVIRVATSGSALTVTPAAYVGALLMALAVAMVLWSAGLFRRRNTTLNPVGEPSALAMDGLYRFSRNPMYLGMLLGLLGLALLLGNGWLLAGPVLFALITARQIANEETVLEQRFGAAYLEYKARVRRWL
jgi:protein-S-isoprenylcysteine O-methyltransferase Ste14